TEEPEEVPVFKRERQRWVQVDASLIDALCDQVSELVAAFGRLQGSVAPLCEGRDARTRVGISGQFEACRSLLDGAVEKSWGLRLAPIEPLFHKLEQHARLLATRGDKEVDIVVNAGAVRLERDVVDHVWDGLLHLVQNAIAHGFEPPEER